jgi:hypothetical protein
MNAGIMEGGNPVYYPEDGVPQGGIISPLLSNIYLHEILDKWFHEVVKPRLKGKAFEIRFADDAVLCFQNKEDAERVMKVLPERLAKYGLELHPEKTKLIKFKNPGNKDDSCKRGNRPGTFNFLGFKHYWKRSRKGKAFIARKTSSDRLTKAIKKIYEWCKKERHKKLKEQHKELIPKIRGHYGYYGINGNYECLARFLLMVERSWYKWLKRRSNRRNLYWEKFKKMLQHYKLPKPIIMHSNV